LAQADQFPKLLSLWFVSVPVLWQMRGPALDDYQGMLRNNVGHHFVRLQDCLHKMSDRGNGMLIWVV
jgi:hypothetical protein